MKKITLLLIVGFLISWSSFAQVAVGEQNGYTSALPISGFYNYSYSQQLIFQNEINAEGDITSVSVFYSSGNTTNSSDWTIYMGHTSKTNFQNDDDWILSTQMSKVFDGIVTYPAGGNQMLVTFDTPFSYNNLDNLVLAVYEKQPDYGGSIYFGKTADLNSNRSIFYRSDNEGFNPADPFMADGREAFINNMILGGIQQICATPSQLIVSDLTTTTALASWTENGSATQWEVIYGVVGFDPASEGTTVIANNNPEIIISGLDPSSEYDVYVAAVCSPSEKSTFRGPTSFITACSFVGVPYALDFENANIPNLPLCTAQQNVGAGNNWKTIVHNQDGFNSTVLTYEWNGNNAADTWFYTQGVELLAGESYELSYKYGNNSGDYTEKMKVAFGTSADANAMTEQLADHSNITGANAIVETILFEAPADGIYYIGFHAYSNRKQYYLYLDDITVDVAPACMPVSDLLAQNITTNSVDLSWSPGGLETQWLLKYGEAGFDPQTQGQSISVNNNPNYSLSGLEQGLSYDFYVTSICENNEGDIVGPETFTTRCTPASIPYAMDFDTSDIPNLPLCTTQENIGGGNNWITTSHSGNGFDSKVLKYEYHTTNAADAWFYTQGVTLEAGQAYEISYKYGVQASNSTEKMRVAYGTSPVAGQMSEELADHTAINNTNAAVELITFTAATTDVYYFGFNVYSDANAFHLFLDNILVEEAPSCYPVSDLLVENITSATADLSWTAGQSETLWKVIYGPIGFEPLTEGQTIDVLDTPEVSLIGLNSASEYEFYVVAVCAVNDESEIVGPVSFITSCGPATIPYVMNFEEALIPALPTCTSQENLGTGNSWLTDVRNNNGFNSKVLKYKYNLTGAANAWFYTQGVQLEAGTIYEISYKYSAQSSTWTEKMKVAYGSSPEASAMLEVLEDHSEIKNVQAEENIVRFTAASTDVYYFGFNVYSNANQYYLYIDDITVNVASPCLPVSDLVVNSLSADTADLSWTPGEAETEWTVLYGPAGFDPAAEGQSVTVNDTPEITLTGLENSTEYDFYVTSICGVNDESEIVGPVSFITTCGPASVPYVVDFEAAIVPALPECTSRENLGDGNNWETTVFNNFGFNSTILRYKYSSSPANAWFYTQGVQLQAGVEYQIAYNYGNNPGNWADKMKVAYGTSAESSAMLNELADYPEIEGGVAHQEIIYFTVDADAIYYFGFHAYSDPNAFNIFLDNIKVDLAPTCLPAFDLIVESLTAYSANLSWTPGQNETEWEVVYGEAGFDPATEGETITVNDDAEIELTDLLPATEYEFYVRVVCGDASESPLTGPVSFTTWCAAASVPYTMDFESATIPHLPDCTMKENLGEGRDWVTQSINEYGFDSKVLVYQSHENNPADAWFYTQGVELFAGTEYQISYKYGNRTNTWVEKMKVAYGTSPESNEMNNPLADYPEIIGGDAILEKITFNVNADGVYYFGYHVYSDADQWDLYLDDIQIIEAPICSPATDVEISDITENAAMVSWTASTSAIEGYQVEVYLEGQDPDIATPLVTESVSFGINSVSVSGLNADTSYDVYVISYCGNDNTAVSEVVNFTTMELGVNLQDQIQLSYFPNPVTNQLNITASGNVEKLRVTNLLGQVVMLLQPRTDKVLLDMSGLPEGTYIVQANIDTAVSTFKVIKK